MTRDWKGVSQADKAKEFEQGQRVCLYNMVPAAGGQSAYDAALHLPYNWQWRSSSRFIDPPADWKPR